MKSGVPQGSVLRSLALLILTLNVYGGHCVSWKCDSRNKWKNDKPRSGFRLLQYVFGVVSIGQKRGKLISPHCFCLQMTNTSGALRIYLSYLLVLSSHVTLLYHSSLVRGWKAWTESSLSFCRDFCPERSSEPEDSVGSIAVGPAPTSLSAGFLIAGSN